MSFEDVLSKALDLARAQGADYADARAEESHAEGLHVRNGAVERLTDDNDAGWGIHVLAGGGWGFASISRLTTDAIRSTVELAIEIARASGQRRKSRSELGVMPRE